MFKSALVMPGVYKTSGSTVLDKPEVVEGMKYHPLAKLFKCGDIFLSTNPMMLGRLINNVSTMYSVDRESNYSHAGLFIDSTTILESSYTVSEDCFVTKYENDSVLVGRHVGMNNERFAQGMERIKEHQGQWYPFHRLFLHMFNLAQFIHWDRVVCSELVSKFLFGAGLRDYKYYGVTPDHLCDEIEHSLNNERTGPQYEIVFKGNLPTNIYKRCDMCKTNILTVIFESHCPVCMSRNTLNTYSIVLPDLIKYNKSKEVK